MKKILFLFLVFLAAPLYGRAPLEPEDGKIIFGIGQDNIIASEGDWPGVTAGQLSQVHEGVERIFESTGVRPLLTHFYVGDFSGNTDANSWTFENRLSRLKSFNATQKRTYVPLFSFAFADVKMLDKFFNGDFDSVIMSIGHKASIEKMPIFFRPFYEFNKYGAHYQLFVDYSISNPEKTKEQWFIDAWKKFRGLVLSGSGNSSNLAFVWCMNGESDSDFIGYYPGDDFVDWVGIDIFNTLHLENAAGPIISWVKSNTNRGDGKPKPVMLPEVQPAMTPSGGGDLGTHAKQLAVDNFFSPLFDFMETNNEVKGFIYINYWFKKLYTDDPAGNSWLNESPLLLWGDGRLQPVAEANFDTAVFDFFSRKIGNKHIYLYEGDSRSLFRENVYTRSSLSSVASSSDRSASTMSRSHSSLSHSSSGNAQGAAGAGSPFLLMMLFFGLIINRRIIKTICMVN